jgi:hypothetical protein
LGVLKDIFKGRGTNASLENFKDCGDLGYYFEVKTRYRKTDFVRRFYVRPAGQILIVDDMDSKSEHKYRVNMQGLGDLELNEGGGVYKKDKKPLLQILVSGDDVIIDKESMPHAEEWVEGEIKDEHLALTATTRQKQKRGHIVTALLMRRPGEYLVLPMPPDILKGKPEEVLKRLSQLVKFKKEVKVAAPEKDLRKTIIDYRNRLTKGVTAGGLGIDKDNIISLEPKREDFNGFVAENATRIYTRVGHLLSRNNVNLTQKGAVLKSIILNSPAVSPNAWHWGHRAGVAISRKSIS